MRERGLLGSGPGAVPHLDAGDHAVLREHPAEGRALMRQNLSWVFFRELTGDGPLGALEVPVRRESSVAADPAYTPLGAPVFLTTDRREVNGLWIAQDTGGAIKGANRFDSFWGAGDEARTIAGGMSRARPGAAAAAQGNARAAGRAVKPPRGLSAGEAALWRGWRDGHRWPQGSSPDGGGGPAEGWWRGTLGRPSAAGRTRHAPLHHAAAWSPSPFRGGTPGLDASWERKLARATIAPDFTLDLHGHTLDQAHRRLDQGLRRPRRWARGWCC
jgi:3D (Asp-Asp-Asp) domain-containing protein